MANEKLDGRVADSESLRGSDRLAGENKLARQLKNRHVAMIRYDDLSCAPTLVHHSNLLSVLVVSLVQVNSTS